MTSRPWMLSRKTQGAGALLALAVLFIGITLLLTFLLRSARIDLTESRLYTLAPGTQQLLSSLDEPVNLYFFFSQQASSQTPPLRAYALRVRELLQEMSARADGKLRLHIIDPQPFSAEEDRATQFGMAPMPLGPGGEPVYFGLAGTNALDGREIIGLFQPDKEEFLEYDIASLIYRLGNTQRATLGLISSLPVNPGFHAQTGQRQPGWAAIAHLREVSEVQPLDPELSHIPDDIGVLLVIHPKALSTSTLYAIDQFVMRGGKLLAFIDPLAENDPAGGASMMAMGAPPGERSSTLEPLLGAWGVQFDTQQVLGDRELGLTVSLAPMRPPSQHIAVVGLNRASMNRDDVITATLDAINVMTAGVLSKREDADVQFEPLLQSSTQAGLLPTARLAFMTDSRALLDDFSTTGQRYTVAARLHGKLRSAYPQRPEDVDATGPHLSESQSTANVILVADTDLLADALWVRTQHVFGQRFSTAWANNGDFLANAVDNLAGSAELISVRGRQSFFRPFTKVDELRRRAGDQLRAKEQELDHELRATEEKLAQLQAGRDTDFSFAPSPEQAAELERFQQQRLRVRQALRDVRRSLDVDIERLGTWLKVINIGLVPVLLAIGAVFMAVVRRQRLRNGRAAAHAA